MDSSTSSPRDTRLLRGTAQGVTAGALWGLVFLAPQVLHSFAALQLSAARYLAYGAIAAVLIAPRWRALWPRLGRADLLALVQLALLGNIVYYLMLATAVQWAGGAATALIIGLMPLVVAVLGSREPGAVPLRRLAAPLALGGLGTALVGWEALQGGHGPGGDLLTRAVGLLCGFGALACWTGYTMVNRRWLARRPDLSAHDASLLVGVMTGVLALGLAVPAFAGPSSGHTPAEWLGFWGMALTVAVFASVVGNACWNRAGRLLPLALMGQMIVFETLFGMLYGFLWEGRGPTVLEVAAVICLLGGVVWSTAAHRPARAVTAPAGTPPGPSSLRPSASSRAPG